MCACYVGRVRGLVCLCALRQSLIAPPRQIGQQKMDEKKMALVQAMYNKWWPSYHSFEVCLHTYREMNKVDRLDYPCDCGVVYHMLCFVVSRIV